MGVNRQKKSDTQKAKSRDVEAKNGRKWQSNVLKAKKKRHKTQVTEVGQMVPLVVDGLGVVDIGFYSLNTSDL